MLYTIGHTESYEQYFREDNVPKKLGIDGAYQGGIVFETVDEAEKYLAKKNYTGYSVYGLKTTRKNRHQLQGEDFWRIKISSELIKL